MYDPVENDPRVIAAKAAKAAEEKEKIDKQNYLLKLKHEYALIQLKRSNLSANQRRKVVELYKKAFGENF